MICSTATSFQRVELGGLIPFISDYRFKANCERIVVDSEKGVGEGGACLDHSLISRIVLRSGKGMSFMGSGSAVERGKVEESWLSCVTACGVSASRHLNIRDSNPNFDPRRKLGFGVIKKDFPGRLNKRATCDRKLGLFFPERM